MTRLAFRGAAIVCALAFSSAALAADIALIPKQYQCVPRLENTKPGYSIQCQIDKDHPNVLVGDCTCPTSFLLVNPDETSTTPPRTISAHF